MIDKILAKDDVELAIEFLMGISESCHPAAHKKFFTHPTKSATLLPYRELKTRESTSRVH